MKKFLRPVLQVVALSAANFAAFAQLNTKIPEELLVKDSYIVEFKEQKPSLRIAERSPVLPALSREEARKRGPVPFGNHSSGQSKEALAAILGIQGKVVAIFDANNAVYLKINANEAERLSKDPRVKSVMQDVIATTSQSAQVNPGWALDRLDQPLPPLNNQHLFNATGAGQIIYILDSGLNLGNASVQAEFSGRASILWDVNGGNGFDCAGHGTQVASAAAGTTHGVAKGATLIIAKITTGCSGSSLSGTWITAFDWLAVNAPKGTIVNLSSGFQNLRQQPGNIPNCTSAIFIPLIEAAIKRAHDAGIIVVNSAGNDGCDVANFTPSRQPEVFVVGATDTSRFAFNQDARASFSRTGANISTFAPGNQVSLLNFDGQVVLNSGTSFSAPYIAGLFAVGCEVIARPPRTSNCTNLPVPSIFQELRAIGVSGSVVESNGAPLPSGTPSRFISRSPW